MKVRVDKTHPNNLRTATSELIYRKMLRNYRIVACPSIYKVASDKNAFGYCNDQSMIILK